MTMGCMMYRDDKEEIFSQPYLMNDGSKEPQEKIKYGTSSIKNDVDFELLWRCIFKIWNQS